VKKIAFSVLHKYTNCLDYFVDCWSLIIAAWPSLQPLCCATTSAKWPELIAFGCIAIGEGLWTQEVLVHQDY
jgi:hypothetical protein